MKKKKETTVEKVEETKDTEQVTDSNLMEAKNKLMDKLISQVDYAFGKETKKKITVYELKDELESLQLICTNLFHVKSQLRNVNQPHHIVESDRNYTAQINAILAKLGNIEI